ncbi:PucR-like helix-turn-helix protein [Murinocardiopsis flavida]|uniref:PucR-like helix-turn-helix protein n=1 Tax=Murinocardiopsis flavida TaxID=645275 RepID=A0A2P8DPB9_9ACTN|nr:PucR family transcriptional regulator [Murinocardiopsis flavida]PSK99067.1 PucR-like helix-turn-helix protein [Murinocardiopsis flavida]
MHISELMAIKRLRLRFLSGAEHAHREVRWAYTTDLLEPRRYLSGGELVLTGMMWRTGPGDSEVFVRSLVDAGVVCAAAGTALGEIPPDLIAACEAHGLPLIEVPTETSFGAVTEEVLGLLTRHRFSAIAENRDRHRRLMAEVAAGADFPEVFAAAAAEAGVSAWVLSSTGRAVAAAGPELSAADREWLSEHLLNWTDFPHGGVLPASEGAAERAVTLLPVRTPGAHPLPSWVLVCTGDHRAWTEETHEAVAELLSIAVLARSRDEEHSDTDARHLEHLPKLLAAQRFGEAAELLRVVGGPAATRAGQGYVVVSAALVPEPRRSDLARRITAELVGGRPGAVVVGDNDAMAIVRAGPGTGGPDSGGTGTDRSDSGGPGSGGAGSGGSSTDGGSLPVEEALRAEIEHGARLLEPGLADHRLTIGISSTARDVRGLRGAVVEARHARRLADLRGGRSQVVEGAEIDSHELLLASVPEDVQSSYRDRMLGPLIEYDRDHRSDLVATLTTFLEHSGSWQRCAAAMHVHVNTLRYRIGRVEELTRRDLSNLEHRVDLFLALKLRN